MHGYNEANISGVDASGPSAVIVRFGAPVVFLFQRAIGFLAALLAILGMPTASLSEPNVDLHTCKIATIAAECGTVRVSAPEARLYVVVMKSSAAYRQEPLFAIDGGPGLGSAQDAGHYFDAELPALILRHHDIVFVDQRGTGLSDPLNCDLFDPPKIVSYFSTLYPRDGVHRCAALVEKHRDLAQFGTAQAADDLDAVRKALGYAKIDLYGASYGTAVAMEYMRRHESTTHVALLDGVAPTTSYLPLDFAAAAQHVLDAVIDGCVASAPCDEAFPHLRKEYRALEDRLERGPVVAHVVDPASGHRVEVTIDRGMFAERLRYFLYDVGSQSAVPLLIHETANGSYDDFIRYAARLTDAFESGFSMGTYLTITCSEDVPFITADEIGKRTAGTLAGDTRVRMHQHACAQWRRFTPARDITMPATIRVPSVLFTGELDPSTPLSESREALSQLTDARLFLIPNAGHVGVSRCEDHIILRFLETANSRKLDGTCLHVVTRPSFVTRRGGLANAMRASL